LGSSVDKAERIRDGERPLSVLRGPKTRAFYRAMTGDTSAGVVDVWMVRAMGLDPKKSLTPSQYAVCDEALQAAAAEVGLPTTTFQAIVWTVVRGGAE
jgi:hypothetical protein